MTEATVPANPGVGAEGTYNYGYDADGRRVWRKKQGTDEVTVFVYGGSNVISDVTIDVTTPSTPIVDSVQRYIHGTTIDELVMVEQDDDTELGVIRNGQWSVMSLYNLSSGTIQKRFNYGVFGQRYVVDPDGTYNTDPTADLGVPYGYTSRRHDPETGMMYFRARYYDPTSGEFVSKDPLEYVDGYSTYRGYFVPGLVDPLGLIKKCACKHYIGGRAGTINRTAFGCGSCSAICRGAYGGDIGTIYSGGSLPLTKDEQAVVTVTGGASPCNKQIARFMQIVHTTHYGHGNPNEEYCFRYLSGVKDRCGCKREETTYDLPGGCTIEFLEVQPYRNAAA